MPNIKDNNTLSRESAVKLSDLLNSPIGYHAPRESFSTKSRQVIWIKCTANNGDGTYDGVPTLYSALDDSWEEFDTVKVKPVKGQTLQVGEYFLGLNHGVNEDDDMTFVVLESPWVWCKVQTKTASGPARYTGCLMYDNGGTMTQLGADDSINIKGPNNELYDLGIIYEGRFNFSSGAPYYNCDGGGFCQSFLDAACDTYYTKLPGKVYTTSDQCIAGEEDE